MQRADFVELFEIMAGLPVTIRLLDPPLHEFLPHEDARGERRRGQALGMPPRSCRRASAELHEFNPMLGFRGCRLAIRYPEITEMQARAIFEAASTSQKTGKPVMPEIMIPLVAYGASSTSCAMSIVDAAEAVESETGARSST